MNLLGWLRRRNRRELTWTLMARPGVDLPGNLRRLPNRLSCCGWMCGNQLEPTDALLCRECASEVTR